MDCTTAVTADGPLALISLLILMHGCYDAAALNEPCEAAAVIVTCLCCAFVYKLTDNPAAHNMPCFVQLQ